MSEVKKSNNNALIIVIVAIVFFCMCAGVSAVGAFVLIGGSNGGGTILREPSTALYQTCLSAPTSDGCSACKIYGEDYSYTPISTDRPTSGSRLCSFCEYQYREFSYGRIGTYDFYYKCD